MALALIAVAFLLLAVAAVMFFIDKRQGVEGRERGPGRIVMGVLIALGIMFALASQLPVFAR